MGRRMRGIIFAAAVMCLGSSLPVYAEEVEPAGYHVYDVQDDEVSDTWYGIARGDYLYAGIVKILKDDSSHAICSGHTLAHRTCDRVYVRIYLDKSDTAKSGTWGNVNYWTGTVNNATQASVGSGSYKVARKKYYRVQGAHSVTKGTLTEATNTCTDALYFD